MSTVRPPPSRERVHLIVCSTCRLTPAARADATGTTGGEHFCRALELALGSHGLAHRVEVTAMSCLFACRDHCTVFVRSAGRWGFLLGRFAPTTTAAQGLLQYLERYLATDDGRVPYAQWPAEVKGHFLARIPAEDWNPAQRAPAANGEASPP